MTSLSSVDSLWIDRFRDVISRFLRLWILCGKTDFGQWSFVFSGWILSRLKRSELHNENPPHRRLVVSLVRNLFVECFPATRSELHNEISLLFSLFFHGPIFKVSTEISLFFHFFHGPILQVFTDQFGWVF